MSIWNNFEGHVADLHALRRLYPESPGETALAKEADYIHPLYRPYIEASPFAVLTTLGPQGLDASPRGDAPGFIQVADEHTLLLPDRRGNHRLDSLKNVLHDPRVALLFMIPGVKETLRVNGLARISAASALLERFVVDGKAPRSMLVIKVHKVFFQCGRALIRSRLWNPERPVLEKALPTPGDILQALSGQGIDGQAYDSALPARQANTLY
ncbi:MAG: pyridoxamine 5'-phosphate oxidase family protein [Burkholderiales bacterium]